MGNASSSTGGDASTTNDLENARVDNTKDAVVDDESQPPTEETSLLGRVKDMLPGGVGSAKSQAPPATQTSWTWLSGRGSMSRSSFADTAEVIAQTQVDPCPYLRLTYSQRFTLFLICFALGTLLSFMSTMNVPIIAIQPSKFAIPFSLGNILSLVSLSFLIGLQKQCKSLFHPDRAIATTVFIFSILTTMWASFMVHSTILTLVSVVVQYLAYIWYCASYIPYGRSFLLGCVKKLTACICTI